MSDEKGNIGKDIKNKLDGCADAAEDVVVNNMRNTEDGFGLSQHGISEKCNHRIVASQEEIEKRKARFGMFITSGKMRLLEEQIRSLNFAICTLEDDRRDLERLYNEEKRKHNESKKVFQAGCGGQ